MSDSPVPGVPAWLPDPSGRHQLRWWDGGAFTDRVANDGVAAIDPGPAPAPPWVPPSPASVPPAPPESVWAAPSPGWAAPPSPSPSSWAVPGLAPAPYAPPAAPPPPRSKVPLIVAGLALVALLGGGAAVFLLGGADGSSGIGTFDGAIDDDAPAGRHGVGLRGPAAVTIVVDPDPDLDPVVGLVVSADDADRIDELYDDLGGAGVLELDEAFGETELDRVDGLDANGQVVFRIDADFAGEEETILLALPFDVDFDVVVAPFEPGEESGSYEITIESFPLDVEEDADGEEVLDAVLDNNDIPADFLDIADEMLNNE